MRKKIWAWIMTVMMVISMMPTSVFAGINDTTKQTDNGQKAAVEQTNAGQIGNYYEVNDTTGALPESPTLKEDEAGQEYAEGLVKTNKTITAGENENEFIVTLDVRTNETIQEIDMSEDAAVVLVIDQSPSMKNDSKDDSEDDSESNSITRLEAAKAAANAFVNSFKTDKDGVNRKIAIVGFSGQMEQYNLYGVPGATTHLGWTDASSDSIPEEIDSLTYEERGWTCLEAGLVLAKNLLNESAVSDITNKNIILLSDGKPTYGLTSNASDSTSTTCIGTAESDFFRSPQINDSRYYTTHMMHKNVERLAESITNSGIHTYAIYLGQEEVDCVNDENSNNNECELKKSGADWLREECGFPTYSVSDGDLKQLSKIFSDISEIIQTQATAWIANDPIGEMYDFTGFVTQPENANMYSYSDTNRKITWNLRFCSPVETDTNGEKVYQLSYKVKLNTLDDNYTAKTAEGEDKFYAANGVTSVTYSVSQNNQQIQSGTAYFNVPSVKGYDADLTFDKVGSFGEALSGAEFTLTHACGDSCKDTQVTNASWAKATSDSNGKVSFANIPSGHKYTLKETKAPGTNDQYTKSNETYTVTVAYGDLTITDKDGNTVDASALQVVNESATIDIEGTKTWNDNNDQDGKRPESITVELYADGQKVTETDGETAVTAVANADNGWKWSFKNLPKYKGGNEITYTIKEVNVPTGYEASNNGVGNADNNYTITNSHTPEKVNIPVSKTWNDADNQDGVRPGSIKVTLYEGNNATGKTLTLNADNNWSGSFTGLDKYKDGSEIEYEVKEEAVTGYTPTVTGNATVGYTITNSHTPAFVSISGTKTWNDGDNQDGIRPENITVRLLADGTEVNSQIVAGTDNTWSYTFSTDKDGENLPKYNKGKEIEYTVSEDAVDGYTVSVNGYDITNTHTPSVTSISGSKTWNDNGDQDGVRPESITVRLHADGKEIDSRTVTAASGWSWSFTNLPVKKAGVAINYTITEDAVKDYTPAINGANITNTHTPDKTSVAVSKAWNDDNNRDGKRASIDVVLYANGTSTGKTITLSENNGWTGTFTGLDKNSNGEAINYTVKEANVPEGYSPSITGDADKGYTITNTYSPEKTSVSGSKTWNDDNNRDGKRPEKITVRLFANDKQIDQKTIGENDGWAWSFDNLYKYENGKEISYTITEDEVAEYATEINGYDITNTYDDFETTEITVNKTWKGDSERERPDAITVKLLADGKVVETVDLTAKDGWTHTFTDLPKYASGKAGTLVVYSVEEEAVEGYTPEIAGFEITNVKNPPADEDTPNPPADPEKPGKSDNGDKAAKTGDDMNIFALAGTAFAALIGAFAAFFRRKKKA